MGKSKFQKMKGNKSGTTKIFWKKNWSRSLPTILYKIIRTGLKITKNINFLHKNCPNISPAALWLNNVELIKTNRKPSPTIITLFRGERNIFIENICKRLPVPIYFVQDCLLLNFGRSWQILRNAKKKQAYSANMHRSIQA